MDSNLPAGHVTQLLARMQHGDRDAEAELLRLAYDPLRALASAQLRGKSDAILQPTVLVHELFLKLGGRVDGEVRDPATGPDKAGWKNRGHFMAVAATAMRQIIIDHLRKRASQKRGGDLARISLSEVGAADVTAPVDLVALNDALERLVALDPRQARLVELKVFGGLSHPEIAEVLATSLRTIEREWRKVRAWLAHELSDGDAAPTG